MYPWRDSVVKVAERLVLAVNAFLEALRGFLSTLIVIIIAGWLTYGRLHDLGLYVSGALAGYIGTFLKECAANYSRLAAEAKRVTPERVQVSLAQPVGSPVKKTNTSWLLGFRRGALIFLRPLIITVVALIFLWLLFNLFLAFYRR